MKPNTVECLECELPMLIAVPEGDETRTQAWCPDCGAQEWLTT